MEIVNLREAVSTGRWKRLFDISFFFCVGFWVFLVIG